MLRKRPTRLHTFFQSLMQMDATYTSRVQTFDSAITFIGMVVLYINGVYFSIKRADERDRSALPFASQVLIFSIGMLAAILTRATVLAVKSQTHPNQWVALDFFENHPEHPEDKKSESTDIFCPISRDTTSTPVCMQFTYDNITYTHACDFYQLKNYFLLSTMCPFTGIDLVKSKDGKRVTNLRFTFDIPQDVPERNVEVKKDVGLHA